MTDYGFIRVSTGSQDAQTQQRDILRAYPGALIQTPDTKAASASKGQQLDALDAVIAKLRKGDRVIVTDSSRLDRRDNLTSQIETMMAIRKTGAVIVSLSPGEEKFANLEDLGSWITTIVQQDTNAAKTRTVKNQTYRGVSMIIANKALHGALPMFWASQGDRYGKQAYCVRPEAVKDIYERVAAGEPLSTVGRSYDLYRATVKNLIRFEANHTGVVECSYTHNGITETWAHKVKSVVDSPLWWRANKMLEANMTAARVNKGGRRTAWDNLWISGVLDCPSCGGKIFLNAGKTPAGNPRTPKLRCGGDGHKRVSCRRFKACNAESVVTELETMFSTNHTPILSFQRIAGNAHELDAAKAELSKLSAQLGAVTDRAVRRETVRQIESLEDQIEAFKITPDSFDYAPTGQTVAQLWTAGDSAVKRGMVRAVKNAGGLTLTANGEIEIIELEPWAGDPGKGYGIVNLGGGLCFRRYESVEHNAGVWGHP